MKNGFTLVELLVVITILAVLAGAALPFVQSYVEESRLAKAKTDLDEIARALAVYETREGEYTQVNVKLLAGRYLNKSPIDPWGSEYNVKPDSGTCLSYGPDRKDGGGDDIIVSYQPPLALTQVKWLDVNNTGQPDNDNAGDELQLNFSRKLKGTIDKTVMGNEFDNWFRIDLTGAGATVNPSTMFSTPSLIMVDGGRLVTFKVTTPASAFVPGLSKFYVATPNSTVGLQDRATPPNFAIKDQKVVILPQ